MNPDTPKTPREELEVRLTALLLGELPSTEAAALLELIRHDKELSALHERLQQTLALVRETAVDPIEQAAPQPEPLKLSGARREKLLAQFKTVKLTEAAPRRRRFQITLIEVAVVVAIIGFVAAMLLPSLSKAKTRSSSVAVLNNLRQLEGAKAQWALEHNASAGDSPTLNDLEPYMGRGSRGLPSVSGETYVPGKVGERASIEVDVAQANVWSRRLDGRVVVIRNRVDLPASDDNAAAETPREMVLSYDSGSSPRPKKPGVAAGNEPPSPPVSPATVPSVTIALPPADKRAEASGGTSDFLRNQGIGEIEAVSLWGTETAKESQAGRPPQNSYERTSPERLRYVTQGASTGGDVAQLTAGSTNGLFFEEREWLGALQRPETPHSASNAFVSRYASIAIPPDQTLDANYVHSFQAAAVPAFTYSLDVNRNGKFDANGTQVGQVIDPATGLPVAGPALAMETPPASGGVPGQGPLNLGETRRGGRVVDGADNWGSFGGRSGQDEFGAGEGRSSGASLFTPLEDLSHPESAGFQTRTYRVDPAALNQGFQAVGGIKFEPRPPVFVSGGIGGAGGTGGAGGGGAIGGGGGGGGGGIGGAGGLEFVTRTNGTEPLQTAVMNYFGAAGVDLRPETGKSVFYNDRTGELIVRGTDKDLDVIDSAVQSLSIAPPEVKIKAKFTDVTQNNSGAMGVDWYAGNQLRSEPGSVIDSEELSRHFGRPQQILIGTQVFTNAGTLGVNGQEAPALHDVPMVGHLFRSEGKDPGPSNITEANLAGFLVDLSAEKNPSTPSAGAPAGVPLRYVKGAAFSESSNELAAIPRVSVASPTVEYITGTYYNGGYGPPPATPPPAPPRSTIVLPRGEGELTLNSTVAPPGRGGQKEIAAQRSPKAVSETAAQSKPAAPSVSFANTASTAAAVPEPIRRRVDGISDRELSKLKNELPSDEAAGRVQNARVLFEGGKLDEAESELKQALQLDPANQEAIVYKGLLDQQRDQRAIDKRNLVLGKKSVQVDEARTATAAGEPLIPAGTLDMRNVPLDQALQVYAELTGRTLVPSTVSPKQQITLKTEAPLTRSEAKQALESVFALNGISVVEVGDKFVKAVPEAQAGTMGHSAAAPPSANVRAGERIQISGQSGSRADDGAIRRAAQLSARQAMATARQAEQDNDLVGAVRLYSDALAFADLGGIDAETERKLAADKLSILQNKPAKNPVNQRPTEKRITETSAANLKPAPAQQTDIDKPTPRLATPPPIPQPEVQTAANAFSTFSLNVSDVSFKLAAASLEKGALPEPASIRSEEFINAFDFRDPDPAPGAAIAFASERAHYPFAHNRDLLRFSLKTAAAGRQAGRPLNLVLLLDNSGSMERADRVQIIHEALRVLTSQLQPQDKISVVTFSRTPRLWVDGLSGKDAAAVTDGLDALTPEGGTNIEEAMNLAYATALRHYLANGINRVVLLTDGAANLGNVEPDALKQKVEANRKQGIALDCFGIGWEGYNDDLLEVLTRNGDGRYGFINSPEEAATDFAAQLAGALRVAASDVKVQVEFNPKRVTSYRQIGYAKHQLTKQQFRDNTVDAAEIAAQEAGNALYTVEINPAGEGPVGTVRVRYKIPGTGDYREQEWAVPYTGNAVSLESASPAMRIAATASAFSEWLAASPFAAEVTPDALLKYLSGAPEIYGADTRPARLEWMIRQAKAITGR